jgi:hypothetical protein
MSVEEFSRTSGGTYTTVVFLDGFDKDDLDPAAGERHPDHVQPQVPGRRRHETPDKGERLDDDGECDRGLRLGTASGFIPIPAEYHVTPGAMLIAEDDDPGKASESREMRSENVLGLERHAGTLFR